MFQPRWRRPSLLGGACRAALDAFEQLAVECYLTGDHVCCQPHTDRYMLWCSAGAKRWRVFALPQSPLKPRRTPARGGTEALDERRRGMLDAAEERDLYIPAGFPHSTATANTSAAPHVRDGADSNFACRRQLRIGAPLRTAYDPLDDPEMLGEVAVDTYRLFDAPPALGRFYVMDMTGSMPRRHGGRRAEGPLTTFHELEDP